MLTEESLKKAAREFSKEHWGLNFDLPVKINNRLSTTSARYIYKQIKGKHIPVRIEVSKRLLEYYKREIVYSVLKHELCHWALAVKNKPFYDGHPVFEKELKRIGSVATHVIQIAGKLHRAACSKCDKIVVEGPTKRSINPYIKLGSRFVSKCCGEKIVYNGTIFREDNNTSVACQPSRNSSAIISEQPGDNSSDNNILKGDGSMTAVLENQGLNIEDLIKPNSRGKVTNAQMIPALVKAIEAGSKEQLDLLKAEYPEVFDASSSKYLNKTHKTAFLKILAGNVEESAITTEAANEVAPQASEAPATEEQTTEPTVVVAPEVAGSEVPVEEQTPEAV